MIEMRFLPLNRRSPYVYGKLSYTFPFEFACLPISPNAKFVMFLLFQEGFKQTNLNLKSALLDHEWNF